MKTDKYTPAAELLGKAIDIAIDAFQRHPPKDFTESNIKHIVTVYQGFKHDALFPSPKFRNLTSLKYNIEGVFTYFQEAGGPAVEYFWRQIKDSNLGYKRENKMKKILNRKRINNQTEYDFVIDVLIPYHQEELISDVEKDELSKMIGAFEQKILKKNTQNQEVKKTST